LCVCGGGGGIKKERGMECKGADFWIEKLPGFTDSPDFRVQKKKKMRREEKNN